jgi:exodeoxyribonuclease III
MKIATWNVNSIRARIENVKSYVKKSDPDILLLQEIKTEIVNYPHEEIEKLGYKSYVNGQKSYNGVAILSKKEISNVNNFLEGDKIKQSRFISSNIKINKKKIELINVYVPNGNPVDSDKYSYKISWLNLLIKYLEKKVKNNTPIIICGDFNVIPDTIDAYNADKYINDALYRLEIRKIYRRIINIGFVDIFRKFNKKEDQYTFWDYMKGSWQKNNGLRIDHILVTNPLADQIKKVEIKNKIRAQTKPSDHVPVECSF